MGSHTKSKKFNKGLTAIEPDHFSLPDILRLFVCAVVGGDGFRPQSSIRLSMRWSMTCVSNVSFT